MIARNDAESGYVLSLLRHEGEDNEAPLFRYYDCDVRIEPGDIQNPTLRSLLYFILANGKAETGVSIKLAAYHVQQPEHWLRERCDSIDKEATSLYAQALMSHVEGGKISSAAEKIASIVDTDLTPQEKLERMRERLAEVQLQADGDRISTIAEVNEKWHAAFLRRQEDIASGKIRVAFPEPLEELNGFVPYLYDGDMVLVTAESGVGKSSMGGAFFDGNLKRGLRGIRFRFEDSDEKAGARRALREMRRFIGKDTGEIVGVPSSRLMKPVVLSEKEHKIVGHARNKINGDWAENGIEVFCYGWPMERVVSVLRRYKVTHDIDFAVFDYLNKAYLPSSKLRNYGLFAARGYDAELVKTATEELGIITLLIQQENPDNGKPFETTQSLQKSQVWLSLQRDINDDGEREEAGHIWVRKANMGRVGKLNVLFDGRWMMWIPR